MNPTTDLLARATDPAPPVDDDVVAADLGRGRRALRRHRLRRAGGPVLSAVVLAGVLTVAVLNAPGADPGGPIDDVAADDAAEPVTLVALTGEQPSGYTVEQLPEGWEVQGATPAYLTIAPIGWADQEPSHFVNKLLVALRSADDQGEPDGTEVPVGDDTGWVRRDDQLGLTVLTYREEGGQWMLIQAPDQLGWSVEQLTEFAAGVRLTDDAVPARG